MVPFALSEFFVKGIPVEETIKSHKNIYDFCGRQKFVGDAYGEIKYLSEEGIKVEKQQKNVRYYISSKGASFIKTYKDKSTEIINKGFQVTIFNKYFQANMEEYGINYDFYIREAYKEIDTIINKQLLLF